LVRFAQARVQLFHDLSKDAFARDVATGEVRRIDGRAFQEWLRASYFSATGRSAPMHAMAEAIATLTGLARYVGHRREVHVRCARKNGAYWLDVGEPRSARAVRIDESGWHLVEGPPCMFVRFESMHPLPLPVRGGTIDAVWRLVNVPVSARLLVLAWLVDCLRPDTPFPVVELIGEQGSAKSTTQSMLRRLLDPNAADLRAAPRTVEDLFVAAGSQWVVSLENVSHLPVAMQDAMCILATGGGLAKRRLYTDADETVITVKRPIILNGISANVTQQDLLDRCISIELPNIAERRDIGALQADMEATIPRILGALLDPDGACAGAHSEGQVGAG